MRFRFTRLFLVLVMIGCVTSVAILAVRYAAAPKPLNLSKDELNGKIHIGESEVVVYHTLGEPITERVASDGVKSVMYFNSRKKGSGNFEVPITVTYYIKDGLVIDRLYRVK